jgi:hypothetical protein
MKKLESTFEKFGTKFETITRDGDIGIFRQFVGENGKGTCFVVARIIDKPDNIIMGRIVAGGESLPPLESWGRLAWTFQTKEKAVTKFETLVTAAQVA